MTATPTVFVTESQLAEQFLAFDAAIFPMQATLARNCWAGWQHAKREGITQHAYLIRVSEAIRRRSPSSTRTPTGLYPFLYWGAALDAGFAPDNRQQGEVIGKALDRLGLSPETVRGHLEAGNLAEVVADSRPPTSTLRLTTESKDTLDSASSRARQILSVDGLSEAEVRSIMPRAYKNAGAGLKDFLIRLGNGEVDQSKTYLMTADEAKPDAPIRPAAPPVSYIAHGKLSAPCYICGRTPAESGFPHEWHHMALGEHEARPNDDTPEVGVFCCPPCHRPIGKGGEAHSRLYVPRSDPDKLVNLLHYNARVLAAYEAFIRQGAERFA